jgi:hypothetical protein
MATQASLFLRNGASVAELPESFMAEAPPDNGDNGRPPAQVVVQDPGVDLAKKTVCIKMRLSTMGNTRKVSTSQIEADADKDGRVTLLEAYQYAKREVARSPGYLRPDDFLAMFRYVRDKAYESKSFRDYLKALPS